MPVGQDKSLIQSNSPEQTLQIGRQIGTLVEPNTVITLFGNLGAGKTWLAKGIAFGLDVPDYEYVNSPAYDLVHEYIGRLKVYHLDLYRLDSLSTDDLLMLQEFYAAGGVCLIEWPSRLEQYPSTYPTQQLAIQLAMPDPNQADYRELTLAASGEKHVQLLKRLIEELN